MVSEAVGAEAQAIEEVYRARYGGFRNALATVTGSHDSARDAVQEGFAIALAKRSQFRGGSLEAEGTVAAALNQARAVLREALDLEGIERTGCWTAHRRIRSRRLWALRRTRTSTLKRAA